MEEKRHKLGEIMTSTQLIKDLYIDLRKKINEWAELTKQTAQARMGYIGQHLASVVTGYQGGKSGARGKDLILPDNKFAEIKTCYRVDQLGKCNSCKASVASIEAVCSECGSRDLQRFEDSKWLIDIRNDDEFDTILDPEYYYLVLFDFIDLRDPSTIRASILRVESVAPSFAYCMVDYYLNIRAKSISKAPFNLWPFQLKFEIMKPLLIYRSLIRSDDTIETEIFPGRDSPRLDNIKPLQEYSRSQNLTKDKILNLAEYLSIRVDPSSNKSRLLSDINYGVARKGISEHALSDLMAKALYYPEIEGHIKNLPANLKKKIDKIERRIFKL